MAYIYGMITEPQYTGGGGSSDLGAHGGRPGGPLPKSDPASKDDIMTS
jgi:hypothetical protein